MDNARGYDVTVTVKYRYIVISFGVLKGDRENRSAGVAIVLDANKYDMLEAKRFGVPKDARGRGRVGLAQIKRRNFDVTMITAYPPPADKG